MNSLIKRTLSLSIPLLCLANAAHSQAGSRGTVAVYPVTFDKTGTNTSRAKAEASLNEVLKKGGFKLVEKATADKAWTAKGYRTPTSTRPPTTEQLVGLGKSLGSKFVCATQVTFHTRSIWVNLGPKTISTCHMTVTIIDTTTGKIAFENEVDGRSDEKTDGLKVAGALLLTPLVTAVSGGPKTPQESRAAQIAAAKALEKFVVAD